MLYKQFIELNKKKVYFYSTDDLKEKLWIMVYICPANMPSSIVNYFNIPKIRNFSFIGIDLSSGNLGMKKSKKNYKWYIKFLHSFILKLIEKYPNKGEKLIISGESWGGNLSLLFAKFYPNLAHVIICWNAPFQVISSAIQEKFIKKDNLVLKNNDNKFLLIMKHLISYLFGINFNYVHNNISLVTNNKKVINIVNNLNQRDMFYGSTLLNIAVFKSMHKSFKFLKDCFIKSNKFKHITYIQSKNDIYFKNNYKKLKKCLPFVNLNNKIILNNDGFHFLSLDPNHNDDVIWNEVARLTSK